MKFNYKRTKRMNVYLGAIIVEDEDGNYTGRLCAILDTLLYFFIQVLCVVYTFLCVMTVVYVKIVSFLLTLRSKSRCNTDPMTVQLYPSMPLL